MNPFGCSSARKYLEVCIAVNIMIKETPCSEPLIFICRKENESILQRLIDQSDGDTPPILVNSFFNQIQLIGTRFTIFVQSDEALFK